MDGVKDDPCVGFLLVAHCCRILSRTDMTNSLSVSHNDVGISSWVEPLCHFPREILEEFDLVGRAYYHEEIRTSSLESTCSGRGHLRPAVNGMIVVYLTGVILPWPLGTTDMYLFYPSSMVERAWNNHIAVPWKIFCRGSWRRILISIVGISNGG